MNAALEQSSSAALRAVHVLPRVVAESSGPSHSVPHLCRGLAQRGVDVSLMVLEPLPARALPFPALAHPTSNWPGAYRLGVSPALSQALALGAHTTDIIHSHGLWMMPNIYPGRVARHAGCKLVMSPRGTLDAWAWQRSRWRKAVVWQLGQGSALRSADLLHATAEIEYRAIRSRGLRQPVAVIPNGVDLPVPLPPTAAAPSSRTLLFLSRIHPKKQVDRLLQAWSRLEAERPDWQLAISGPLDNPYAVEMQALARRLGLRRVEFSGELGGQLKNRAYQQAELFVLPTRGENFGLVVAEALAAGTPVVTTHGTPWSGLLEHRCGWWIADDAATLEHTLRSATAESPATLAAMGARGRRWMASAFGWESVAGQMAATYLWMLGRASKPDCIVD